MSGFKDKEAKRRTSVAASMISEETIKAMRETQEDGTRGTTSTIIFGETQGRKGHKAPRINMAFSPENHEWIKTRSRQLGMSATEFVNTILTNERLKG